MIVTNSQSSDKTSFSLPVNSSFSTVLEKLKQFEIILLDKGKNSTQRDVIVSFNFYFLICQAVQY